MTFGKFDGLHRGHQVLVTKVRELGEQENINSIVCSFDMRPLWKEMRDYSGTSEWSGKNG